MHGCSVEVRRLSESNMITRRRALTLGAGIVASATVLDARFGRGERTRGASRLPIPRLIDAASQGNVVHLKAAPGSHEFYKGKPARTFGYSAPILGPVLRFHRGDRVEMTVENAARVAQLEQQMGIFDLNQFTPRS